MTSTPELALQLDHDLGAIRRMPEFRALIERDALTKEQRELLAEQAATMIDGLYVHLLHKRAMYAIEPSQRLRLLQRRLPQLTDPQFNSELLRIFYDLHDLHTTYTLPRPYQGPNGPTKGPFAFLGIYLEQYWKDEKPHWLVSKIFAHLHGDPQFVRGAEVLHWNGVPIAVAVARAAERAAGANAAARSARGLDSLTLRVPALAPPPDEDWVDLHFAVDGSTHETRIPWLVFDSAEALSHAASGGDAGGGSAGDALAGEETPPSQLIGLDLNTEILQGMKKRLFAPAALERERRMAAEARAPMAEPAADDTSLDPRRPELRVRTVTTAHGTFGHLRIDTFFMKDLHPDNPDVRVDIKEFIDEVQRLLPLMPKQGLILDVRGNPGGYVKAAETLLQFLTPRRIQPEPTQFISTRMTAELCEQVRGLQPWGASINASIETGAQYSSAIPLYDEADVNAVGQLYHGPVVLVTDALCYSATDFFAAGFQDHEIGKVLGVDDNTGAGGANVWEFADLLERWPAGPFKPLPGGAGLRVSLRRCLRVGKRWGGQAVEDLGVLPDVQYRMTRRDQLENNPDLMEKAGELLAQGVPRTLDVRVLSRDRSSAKLEVTTAALTSLDVYLNSRPVATTGVTHGTTTITVPISDTAPVSARLEGFDDGVLVAARTVHLQ